MSFLKDKHEAGATALRLRTSSLSLPRVAEAATLGWRALPRWGINEIPQRKFGRLLPLIFIEAQRRVTLLQNSIADQASSLFRQMGFVMMFDDQQAFGG